MIKDILKKWLRVEVMEDFWQIMDSVLKHKNHHRDIWEVNGRYYEIVRRYKRNAER